MFSVVEYVRYGVPGVPGSASDLLRSRLGGPRGLRAISRDPLWKTRHFYNTFRRRIMLRAPVSALLDGRPPSVMAITASTLASVKQWHVQKPMCHCLNDAGMDLMLLLRPAGVVQAVLPWSSRLLFCAKINNAHFAECPPCVSQRPVSAAQFHRILAKSPPDVTRGIVHSCATACLPSSDTQRR